MNIGYVVVLTQNYSTVGMVRCETEKDAERSYQKYKKLGYGVIKAKLEKAHELNVMTV